MADPLDLDANEILREMIRELRPDLSESRVEELVRELGLEETGGREIYGQWTRTWRVAARDEETDE